MVVDRLGGLVDRVLGVERSARAPGVVDDFDVVLHLVVEDVIEAGKGEEDEQHVPRPDAHQVGARRDPGVVAVRGDAETRRDP